MKIHTFQHVQFESPAMIADWAKARGHSMNKVTRFYRPDYKMPDVNDYDALLIMGGPMGVEDHYSCPWLMEERTHIKQAIHAGKYVLGICLGAQLIARALGAKVEPHPIKEIGWHSVSKTPKGMRSELLKGLRKKHVVFHWHADRFEIPKNARHLMESTACPSQAFSYQARVLALQYHLEMDEAAITRILKHCGHEIVPAPYIQSAQKMKGAIGKYKTRDLLYRLLDNWTADAPPGRKGK